MIPMNSLVFHKWEFHLHGTGNFSTGMGKVQTLQTNQSLNDDVMNMNG